MLQTTAEYCTKHMFNPTEDLIFSSCVNVNSEIPSIRGRRVFISFIKLHNVQHETGSLPLTQPEGAVGRQHTAPWGPTPDLQDSALVKGTDWRINQVGMFWLQGKPEYVEKTHKHADRFGPSRDSHICFCSLCLLCLNLIIKTLNNNATE